MRELSTERDQRRGGPIGGDVMLAYGLNKNLKKLQIRPKSAKPAKKRKGGLNGGRGKQQMIDQEEYDENNNEMHEEMDEDDEDEENQM